MIVRSAVPVLVAGLLAGSLAGCSGSSSDAAAPAPSPVTVTTTVTPPAPPPSPTVAPSTSSASATVSPSAAATGTQRCDAPALVVASGPPNGAAGTVYYSVVFRNTGEQPCFLRGFPGVSAADASGAGKVDAVRDTTKPATRVVLDPGQSAHAVLAVRNVPPTSAPCPSYPTLLVTPPDSRQTQRVVREVSPCAKEMRISVVQPGAA